MIIEGQKVTVKWNGRNKNRLTNLGYNFTKLGEPFEIDVNHISKGSDSLILVKCDYCDKEKTILYNQYYTQSIKVNKPYACKNCIGIKISKNHEEDKKGFKHAKKCTTRENQGIIYIINESRIELLSESQKILINEIVRFCEEHDKFPTEKDMTNKKGYVSRTQFYKYFNTDKFINIYDYIYPLQRGTQRKDISIAQKEINKPKTFKCSKCKIEKEFTKENFSENKENKYGLKTTCRTCDNKYANLLSYKHKGIIFENFEDIKPEQWWDYLNEGKIGYLPDFCLEEENIIKIVRYVFLEKIELTKKEICEFNLHDLKNYKIFHLYTRYYNKLQFLNLCFPEMKIKSHELLKSNYSEDDIMEFVEYWIHENSLTINDLLNSKYDTKSDKKMLSLVAQKFDSYVDMLTRYFNKKGTLHPIFKRKIEQFDFASKPNNFWDDESNRINAIKTYCIDNGIMDIINDTASLKDWVYTNFCQSHVSNILNYSNYYTSLYDALVTALPEIKNNKILFEWEWHQSEKNDRKFLIQMLREMIIYRENKTTIKEISSFLRYTTLKENGYIKFTKHVSRKRFNSYYEWACLSFPEFSNEWKEKDFYDFVAKDGTICDSLEEVKIYEFIKYDLKINNINAIGTLFKGEHIFKLPNESEDNWYCPDFVIKTDENKKIYIEYFGLYTENPTTKLLKSYKNKTLRKIKYYNSLINYDFIYIYPKDLKEDFKGVCLKLNDLTI